MIKLEAGRYLIALPLLISKIFPSDQLSSASLTKKGTGQKAEGRRNAFVMQPTTFME
jgi:hypothetical protein